MFRNGLNPRVGVGMDGAMFRDNLSRHVLATETRRAGGEDVAHPDQLGYAMLLNARGNVYGDNGAVAPATKARRRAANKRARAARRAARR